jgi:hypothetical protein
MKRAFAIATLWAIAGVAAAQELAGEPVSDEVVRDAEFGVVARHFGLERRVAMYQWRSEASGYERAWSEQRIDSATFAPGHDNPAFPLRNRRWVAGVVTVDGKPLAAGVIERLGEWRPFRPNFSALPGNLAATFQPEGDGLGSAENPLAPQVGDLRIHWRELTLPPLEGRIVLKDGRWQLRPGYKPEAIPAVDPQPRYRAPWLFGGSAIAVLLGIAIARRRRKRVEPDA